jgi:hypothetical protein
MAGSRELGGLAPAADVAKLHDGIQYLAGHDGLNAGYPWSGLLTASGIM